MSVTSLRAMVGGRVVFNTRAKLLSFAILEQRRLCACTLKESMAPMAVIPRFAKWSNRRDYSSVVECSFLLPQGSRRQPSLVSSSRALSRAPQLQEPRPGTCRRAGLRRAACAAGTETDAGPRTMKAMRDLQFARKLLANVLRCDAVQFYTRLENVAQDSQTPIWSRGPQS